MTDDVSPLSEEQVKALTKAIADKAEKLIGDPDANFTYKQGVNYVFIGNVPKDPAKKQAIQDMEDLFKKNFGS